MAFVVADDRFESRCNAELVDLEPVELESDITLLHRLLMQHRELTGSDRAAALLAHWPGSVVRFVKVMPRDYRRALASAGLTRRSRSSSTGRPRMADPVAFLTIGRRSQPTRPVADRVRDWRSVYLPSPVADLREQASRCMDCGIPFCHQGCPLGNVIPSFNGLVHLDRWREAIDELHATNNFPELTGQVCPAPCEGSCVLALNDSAGDDQVHRGGHRRAGVRRRMDRAASAAPQDRHDGGRGRLRSGRSRRRGPVEQGRPSGHRVRARGPSRRPAALRDSRVQARETAARAPALTARRRRCHVSHRRGRRARRHGRRAAQPPRRRRARRRCDGAT